VEHIVPGHVVVVRVGVEDVRHGQAKFPHARCEFGGFIARIDDGTDTLLFIADQIAKIAIASSVNLFKNHRCFLL
jgi:hypothetical protein